MQKEEIKFLKDAFLKALPVLKANSGKDAKGSIASWHFGNTNTKVILFTPSELALFEEPINFALEKESIRSVHAEFFIRLKIISMYHYLLVDDTKIDSLLSTLIGDLESKPKKYFVCGKVENILATDEQEYALADSVIRKMDEKDLQRFDTFSNMEIRKMNTEDLQKFGSISKKEQKPDLEGLFIFTEVNASDDTKAEELAVQNFTISFNLLRLIFGYYSAPALAGCSYHGKRNVLLYDDSSKDTITSWKTVGQGVGAVTLSKQWYDALTKAGGSELSRNTLMSKILKESLYWFGLGLDEKHPSAKLLNFVMVLESLLKKKGERNELTRAVSERGAILLQNDYEQRKKIVKDLREIYGSRSSVVHTGILYDNTRITALAESYAKAALIITISAASRFNGDFEKFIDALDDIKLSGVAFNS